MRSSSRATNDWPANVHASAAIRKTQPDGEHDFRRRARAGDARGEDERPEPARHGRPGHQAQPSNLALARLTRQLQAHRPLGALALRLGLLPLELEAAAVAIESLLQRRDDDPEQARVEAPAGRRADDVERLMVRLSRAVARTSDPTGDVDGAERRVQHAEPGKSHVANYDARRPGQRRDGSPGFRQRHRGGT